MNRKMLDIGAGDVLVPIGCLRRGDEDVSSSCLISRFTGAMRVTPFHGSLISAWRRNGAAAC